MKLRKVINTAESIQHHFSKEGDDLLQSNKEITISHSIFECCAVNSIFELFPLDWSVVHLM